jgi:hypothetical protein
MAGSGMHPAQSVTLPTRAARRRFYLMTRIHQSAMPDPNKEIPDIDRPDSKRPGESFPAQEHPAVQEPVTEPVPQYPPGDRPGDPGHTPTSPPPVTSIP